MQLAGRVAQPECMPFDDPNFPPLYIQRINQTGPVEPLQHNTTLKIIEVSEDLARFPIDAYDTLDTDLLQQLMLGKSLDYIASKRYRRYTNGNFLSAELRSSLAAQTLAHAAYKALLFGMVSPPEWQSGLTMPALSRNERLYLYMVDIGLRSPLIAMLTEVKTNTVNQTRRNIMGKLGGLSMTQATAHAFSAGILRPYPEQQLLSA